MALGIDENQRKMNFVQVIEIPIHRHELVACGFGSGRNPDIVLAHLAPEQTAEMIDLGIIRDDALGIDVDCDELVEEIAHFLEFWRWPLEFTSEFFHLSAGDNRYEAFVVERFQIVIPLYLLAQCVAANEVNQNARIEKES